MPENNTSFNVKVETGQEVYGEILTLLRGYSPYELALKDGFVGTEEEWLASLVGETGETGNGIENIVLNDDYTLTISYTNGDQYTTPNPIRGEKGETGNGIKSATLNPDYSLTLLFTDGGSYTTIPIRGLQGERGLQGIQGIQGETGNGISRVKLNSDYTLTIYFTDGAPHTTSPIRGAQGEKGETGNGIKYATMNPNYTLTIKYTDGSEYTTPVLRGAQGIRGIKGETGNGIDSAVLNPDYTLTLNFTDGTSYTTTSIRGQAGERGEQGVQGEPGNGIAKTTLNPDYTLTLSFTDGSSYTTSSIRGMQGIQGIQGANGADGVGIASATMNQDYTLTLLFTDGTHYTTPSLRGATGSKGDKGDTGNGIDHVQLNNDYTLTLYFDDGTQYTTTSIRGEKGEKGDSGDSPTITTTKSGKRTTIYANDSPIGTVDDGDDGSTPSITASKSGSVTTISVNGNPIAEINDGIPGQDGDDGYSPSASVSKSGSTTTITITDKNGTTTAEVHDGQGGTGTIDPTPTEGSTNAVSSGGVYTELSDVKGSLNHLQDEIDGVTIQKQEVVDVQMLASRFVNAAGSNYGITSSSSLWTYSNFVSCEKYSSIDITMPKVKRYTDAGIVFYSDNIGGNIPDNCVAGYICNYGTSGDPVREVRNFVVPEGAKYFRTSYRTSLSDFSCIGHWTEASGGLQEIRHDIEQLEEQLGDIPSIDETLSIQGDAADAKAVGDAIQYLQDEIEGGVIEKSENVSAIFIPKYILIANSSDGLYGNRYRTSNAALLCSDFVNIEKYKRIEITMPKYIDPTNAGIVFYSDMVASNIPNNCVVGYCLNSGASASGEYEIRTFDIPEGAKYFRATSNTSFEFSCIGYYDKTVEGLDGIYDTLDIHEDRIESLEELNNNTGIAIKVTDFDDGVKTDDQIIADAFAFASNYQQKTIIFDTRDWNISTAILLESNTTVYIDDVKIKQNDLTFDNVFRGKNFVVDPNYPNQFALSVSATENIRIIGLNNAIIEGPDVNTTIYNPYQQQTVPMIGDAYGWRAFQIYICDCDGIEISGLKITKTRNWAISFEFCKNGHIHDIEFDTTDVKNGDGVDLRIGCHHFRIHDITGYTKDDTVACTALYPAYNNSSYPSQTSPSMYPCTASRSGESIENTDQRMLDIHDVVISNIFTGGAEHSVICLCNNGLQVYNIGINNVIEKQRSSRGAVVQLYKGYNSSWHPGSYSDNDLHNISVGTIESNAATYAFHCNCKVANVYVNKLVQNKSGGEKYSITNMNGITITNSGD